MAEQESYQLQGNAPQIYEEHSVSTIFQPLAKLTLHHVDVEESARVIDVACGTGIVGRLVAEKLGKSGSVVGVDLNDGMIEVAKRSAPVTDANVEWRQGDVSALPFPDASFDIAFCQQGLQFFPDKLAALKEIRRILTPGGTLILTVWSSIPPSNAAIADALTRYVGAEVAKTSLAPFSFHDPEVIQALFVESGFLEIQMEILTFDRLVGPAEESIPKIMASAPYANEVEKLDLATREAMVMEIGESMRDYRTDIGFTIPMETYLFRGNCKVGV